MTLSMKALLAATLAVAAVLLAWTGGLLYWQVRIEGAIRTLERDTVLSPPSSTQEYLVPAAASELLDRAGCRALPYLVAAVDGSKGPAFLAAATSQIVSTLDRTCAYSTQDCEIRTKRREDLLVDLSDAPAVRAAKCVRNKEWWRAHGSEIHQGWRFWSAWCSTED